MGVILDDFRSLRSFLVGIPSVPGAFGGPAPDVPLPGPWEPAVLVRAIQRVGVMGCDRLGQEGDFDQDSPQAQEAIKALLDYRARLRDANGDEQAFWAVLPDDGPLERYGWDSEGLPPLNSIAQPVDPQLGREASLKESRNDRKLIAALAAALTGHHEFGRPLMPGGLDAVAQAVEVWAQSNGIKGLGETTVKAKIRAAWKEVEERKGPKKR